MIYTALSFVFAILFFYYHNYLFLLLILGCIYLGYKRNRKEIFIVSQIILFIFCLFRFTYFNIQIPVYSNEYKVIEKYPSYVILESNNIKYLYYDDSLNEGNKLIINGKIELLDEDNKFYKYLKTQKVNYVVKGNVLCNDNFISYNERIITKLLSNKNEDNKSILKLILFNQKDDSNDQFYGYFETFSISFLLVISGFHINLLLKILKNRKYSKYALTLFYLYLLDFSVSSYKAFLYFCLKKINKKIDLPFNNSDILSLIMISFLFINPSYLFNQGFVYSFSFSFVLDIINNIIVKKSILNAFIKKLVVFLFSIPIILNSSYQLNSNAFIVSILFVYPISFLFIFSLIYLFLDKFYLVYKLYIYLLRLLLGFFDKFSYNFVFGKPSYVVMILLYGCLLGFLFYYQNKIHRRANAFLLIYFLIILFQYNLPNLSSREEVYFLDVGQGDCTILKIKNSKKVVLIDTGGNKYRDLANDTIIPFLKKKGINEIEKIIISHDDYDHNGSKEELMNNFKVNQVIDDSSITEIFISDKKFINLNVSENRDNDDSIVLYGEYGGLKYLFTGDISSEIEEKIIKENENLKVDILKVSHHGSNGSSSEMFLDYIDAKVALIGVGDKNIYNHPHSEVIMRLNNLGYAIYRTDLDGDIIIYKSLFSEKIIIEK